MTKYRTGCRGRLLSALVTCTGIANQAAAAPPAYIVTDLGTLGGTYNSGVGINASGQVAGWSFTTGNAAPHAFLWTPTTPNGASGTLLDLGTLGGTHSLGNGINASGLVTGYSYATGDRATLAFMYDGALHDLGTLGGASSEGRGINDSGQVTGYSYPPGDFAYHAFLYDGALHDLGTLGGVSSSGNGINASGQVTGRSYMAGDAAGHAFLYDGTLHDLGTLGGTWSVGNGLNDIGQVTGYSFLRIGPADVGEHAFLYTSGSGMVDLNSLIDPLLGWELTYGSAINNAGQITGNGYIGGEQHAFLLNPVPEPTSLALFALGLPFLVWRHLRQLSTGGVRGVRRFARTAAARAVAEARSDQ